MPGGWAGSNRKAELPPHWYTHIRPAVLERDGYQCTWHEHGRRCTNPATDVDHIGDKHNHDHRNLRSLCGDHHRRRTSRQGNAARWAARPQRPPTKHPGLL